MSEDEKTTIPAGRFMIGLLLFCVGSYLLLNSIVVSSALSFGSRLYGVSVMGSQFGVTSGMILIPFIVGVSVVFYDYKRVWGWLLAGISLAAMVIGVITSIRFVFRPMSSFELIVMLVLIAGGMGMMIAKKQKTSGK